MRVRKLTRIFFWLHFYFCHGKIKKKEGALMKRVVALILCAVTVLTLLGGCAQEGDASFAGIVEDPKTWYEEFMKIPVATADMTEDELRQICVDAFKANLTFLWTPNSHICYSYELLGDNTNITLPTGNAYSGLCYASGQHPNSCGTIWKVLPYYDPETGVVDVKAMGDNFLNYMSSACAFGAMQGWNRVSNSHRLVGMHVYSQYESGILPVGPYTYTRKDYGNNFSSRSSSKQIIAANSYEVMLESLAAGKKADGLFSSSAYHVMMYCEDAVVVRNDDNTINPIESYVLVHEQNSSGSCSDQYNYKQSNGIDIRPLGTTNNKYTFAWLLEKGYIPFTVKELVGKDPVEPGKAWLGSQERELENGTAKTLSAISNESLCANYSICTLLFEVKSPNGTVLDSYIPAAITSPVKSRLSLRGLLEESRYAPYADGKNTIHISARLGNGEMLEAFHTVLKIS